MRILAVLFVVFLFGVPDGVWAAKGKIKFYRNPMDPSIHSNVPMKDSMGMDYIPVYEEAVPEAEGAKAEGRAAVQLSPEQLRLSGVRIVQTERRDLEQELRVPGRSLGGGKVSFQVFEQDLPLVAGGEAFRASSPSMPGEPLSGRVTSVETILDPMTRTARVNGVMSSPAGTKLRTEASLSGVILVKHPAILTVPEEAVLHTGSRDLVFVALKGGALAPRPVSLGARAGGLIEIKSGLEEGESVSSGPNFLLDAESKIQATYDSSGH